MMKRFLALLLVFFSFPCYAADVAQNAVTDGSGSVATSHYLNGYSGTTSYRYTIASILGLKTSVTGNAGTATALAADPAGCTGGQVTTDINASGVASCTSWAANMLSLLGSADYATARTNLGLAIGTNVQAYDADLTTYAGITPSANIQTLLGSADYSAARTNLGLAIGTNVQAYNSNLTGINQALTNTSNPAFSTLNLVGSGLTVGTGSTNTGSIQFKNSTNNNIFTLQSGVSGAALSWTLPTAAPGGANYLLNVDADGTMGYTDPAGFAVPSGALGTPSFTALNLPSSNADPGTTAGQVRHDSTVTNFTRGAVRWYDGTGIRQFVDLAAATAEGCGDGYSVTYNATDDLWQCTNIAGGSMTYPGAGIGVSTGSAWTTSLTAPSGALVGTTDTQTLSGKTLTIPLIGNGSTGGGYAEFREDTDNGTNYVRVKAPDALGADYVATLPAATGTVALSSTAAYDASTWDSSTLVPDQNAVRDYLESKLPSGADGSYGIVLTNNSAKSPTASTDEIYFEANIAKVNQNGTEYSAALGPTATQINFSGTLTNNYLCTFATGGAISCNTNPATYQSAITFGTNVLTALGVNIGSAGAPVLFNGAGGTPTSLNLTNAVTNSGTSLPGTCTVGAMFLDTDADTNGSLFTCVATNTWKEVDDDGGAGGMATTDIDTSAEINTIVTDNVGTGGYLMFNTAPTVTTSIAPASADGATIGSATAEWSDLFLAAGAVIYGEADQSNTLTSSSTGWNLNLPLGLYQANDPDVAAEGKMAWDANGDWLRIHDGTNQVAVARKTECHDATVVKPNDLADGTRDAFRMWQNNSGMSFIVTSWTAQSSADNTDLNIETTTNTGGTNATVDAVSITTDGTGLFYASDSTITAGTITNGSIIWLDFDDTDTPDWVSISVCGYYNGDVN